MSKYFVIHEQAGTAAHTDACCGSLEQEAERLKLIDIREHFEQFAGFAATCKRENTYEWMCQMLDWLNGVCDRLDPSAFFVLRGASHFDLQRCERETTEKKP